MAINTWIGTTSNWDTGANWSQGSEPGVGDTVRIPAGSGSIAGSDQSANVFAAVIVEEGYTGTIGSSGTNLIIKTSIFEFHGTGLAYINLSSTAVSPQIFDTATPSTGTRGLYLIGTAIATLNVVKGAVGLAYRSGEVSTITTAIRLATSEASVWCGAGVTLPTLYQTDGESLVNCAVTTAITVYAGTCRSREVGAVALWNAYGGESYPESSGTITSMVIQGGEVNMLGSNIPRTVSAVKLNPGQGPSIFRYSPAVVTVSSVTAPDFPISKTVTAA